MVKMPITKKRTWKKRASVRGRTSRPRTVTTVLPRVRSINGYGIGFPQKLSCRLKYGQVFTQSVSSGLGWYNIFRGNSIHDPDFTGVGHQPRYHDVLESLYRYYHVTASSIKVSFHNTTDQGGLLGYIIPDASTDSAAIPTSAQDVIELPGSVWKTVASETSGPAPLTLYMKRTSSMMQEEDRTKVTAFGQNPTNGWDYVVGLFNASAVASGAWVTVELIYDVICSELVEPGSS